MRKKYPIYFIHGYKGAPENFAGFKKYYPDASYISLPWHFSEFQDNIYDRDFCLLYLKKFIKKPGILVGHSLGGLLSQEFAIKYPSLVKRVFLLGYPLDNDSFFFKVTRLKALSHRTKHALHLKRIDMKNIFIGNALFNILFFLPLSERISIQKYYSVSGRIKANIFEYLLIYNRLDRIKKIKQPVVFINGERDFYNSRIVKTFQEIGPSYIISGMTHKFAGHEEEILAILKKHLV